MEGTDVPGLVSPASQHPPVPKLPTISGKLAFISHRQDVLPWCNVMLVDQTFQATRLPRDALNIEIPLTCSAVAQTEL